MDHIKLFEDFEEDNLKAEDVLDKDELKVAKDTILAIKGFAGDKKPEDASVVDEVISRFLKVHHYKYTDFDDYKVGMHNIRTYVAGELKLDLFDDVQTVEEFEEGEKKKAAVGAIWAVHYGAPGTGMTEYKVEKIEDGKVYSKITKDTGRELDIADVI